MVENRLDRLAVASIAVIFCLTGLSAARAQTVINLPGQSLETALALLSRQSGLDILAPGELVARRQAPAVSGILTVRPTSDSEPVVLTDGEQVQTQGLRFAGTPVTVDARATTAWEQGRIEFDNTSLAKVIEEVRRYRRAPVVLKNPLDVPLTLTGSFSIDDPDRLLRALPSVLPLNVSFLADGTAIVAAR